MAVICVLNFDPSYDTLVELDGSVYHKTCMYCVYMLC